MNKFLTVVIFALAIGYYVSNRPKQLSATEIDSQCDVVMFTTSWCPYCKKAREFFNEQPVNTCEKDIEASAANKTLYDDLGGNGVPLIIIGDEQIMGFRPDDYTRALKAIEL